ncbi:Crp/Fnr family transcriptional regulator [Chitinophaga sp. 212800010-3]|uniref:Crp/Fnr family transcriptional regulator n=1 Tax=unclassified Chitinophaga TaxID=2619133 RepID=UPI002DF40945|nr:Crp/Fnr family transcriptional regulator [Chitinophaga sp. 212800010-3]
MEEWMNEFFSAMEKYTALSAETKVVMQSHLHLKKIKKQELYLAQGVVPQKIAYICKGLLSYYTIHESGDTIIKRFFQENSFVASTSALIKKTRGLFAIEALENTIVLEFSFHSFKALMHQHTDLAFFWINYLEENWVAGKEEQEITLKYLTAKERYLDLIRHSPELVKRLKQHHIAAFLGVTPTQLSRIRKDIS